MHFHKIHGSAIQLKEAQSCAVRNEDSFCNGIVFSEQALKINQRVCVELGCSTAWSGGLRAGVTTINPSTLKSEDLPRFAYPNLTNKPGYFLRVINESLTATTGCQLIVYLTIHGQLQLFINGQHKGCLLLGLPTNQNLWLLFDIYGNTNSAKFVKPDDAPREILARGPEAVEAYEMACTCGTQAVHRARLMLVGQEGVGKTSLKRSLTGQGHDQSEESTDGIDLSSSCSFTTGNRSSWKLSVKGNETVRRERLQDSIDLGLLGGVEGLEEEYNRAIATNIAQELLALRRKPTQTESTDKSYSTESTTSLSSHSKSPSTSRITKDHILSEMNQLTYTHQNLPDRVVDLVQEIMNKVPGQGQGGPQPGPEKPINSTVVLNIWDFAGQAAYYTTHQVFLTSRALYCFVFNLCDDLSSNPLESSDKNPSKCNKMTTLQHMDFWMHSIHAHAAENTKNKIENITLSPPIFIVGTHRDGLDPNPDIQSQMVLEKFAVIREFLIGKPYAQHIVLPFYAVENNQLSGEDVQIDKLREEIERVASQQPYVGEQMPVKWLRFEQDFTLQGDKGINFASYDQVYEMAVNHDIIKPLEVQALLNFYHDLGMLVYYNNHVTTDYTLSNTVVLNPQWLINMFKKVTASFPPKEEWNLLSDKWSQLIDHGILEDSLLSTIWSDTAAHQPFLLALMAKFDLICPRLPPAGQTHKHSSKSFYVPMRFGPYKDKKKIYAQTAHDARFYIDLNGFLPDGLFHRIQARTINWSQEHGGRDMFLAHGIARVFVDSNHDLLLEMCPRHLHRIKVLVMHVKDKEATSSKRNTSPTPAVVAKVRNFLEACLVDLRSMWMKRLAYKMCFQCPCECICELHDVESCPSEDCMHFLDMDECLSNQIVCCEHRRVKTEAFKKWFPAFQSQDFKEPIMPLVTIDQGRGNIERHVPNLPSWLKGAAKLLNGAPENQDWLALARLMGYKQGRIDMLNEDLNPALALLTDWIVSSGNTSMSVDVLLHYLQQMGSEDVVNVINMAKEYDIERPQIFLSYQWDIQDEVNSLRDHLERAGYSCWMDIGQMGGGDQLSSKIDQGLRNCKVVLACITPKYIASHLCNRELWLSDMLQKPIIPVVMETVSWPPPGGMAVILSQLVYINMKGVGGHGGSGIHADLKDKYTEVIQRVSLHAKSDLTPCVDTTVVIPAERTDRLSDRFSGYRTSMSSLSEVDFHHHTSHNNSSMDVMLSRHDHMPDTANYSVMHDSNQFPQRTNSVPQAHVKKCAVCSIL